MIEGVPRGKAEHEIDDKYAYYDGKLMIRVSITEGIVSQILPFTAAALMTICMNVKTNPNRSIILWAPRSSWRESEPGTAGLRENWRVEP
jgi:hypothetical protein